MDAVHPVCQGWKEEPFWLTAPGEMKVAGWGMHKCCRMSGHEMHLSVFSSPL